MGTVARGAKRGGGTDFSDSTVAEASEVNTDFNTLYTEVNGALDEDNISGSAQIPNSSLAEIDCAKVSDNSEDSAAFLNTTAPGDTVSQNRPTDLEEELEILRYRIGANRHLVTNLNYIANDSSVTSAGWLEPSIVGPNLAPNAGLEAHSGTGTDAPVGWAITGTPTGMAIDAAGTASMGLDKRSFRVLAGTAGGGINYTVGGLKAGVKYLCGVAYDGTVGEFNLDTTGALATGAYKNVAYSDATTPAVTIQQFILKAAIPATDVVVNFTGTADDADFNLHYVWFYELTDNTPIQTPHIPMQTASTSTEATFPTTWVGADDWQTDTLTDLSLSQYAPMQGYRFVYEVSIPFVTTTQKSDYRAYAAIQLQIDAGSVDTVEGPVISYGNQSASADEAGDTFNLKYMVENPTPGSTYNFTLLLGVYDTSTGAQIDIAPLRQTEQMTASARLYTERI